MGELRRRVGTRALRRGAAVGGDAEAITFDVIELVRGWRSGAYANHGIALAQDTSVTGFATSEAEAPSMRPQLDVCLW